MRMILLVLAIIALSSVSAIAGPRNDATQDTLSVVTLNLWHDKADWPTRQTIITDELRKLHPDVIVLQEVLQHATLPNQAQTLAAALEYEFRFFSIDTPTAERRYGNAILTRHPILADGWIALEPLDDYRNAGHVRIDVGGQPIDVYATHLHYQPAGHAVRNLQARGLLDFIARTRHADAVLLAGDFNAPADAPEFAALAATFGDAYDTLHPAAGQTAFGHSTLNPFLLPPLRVDHVWFEATRFEPVDATRLFDRPQQGVWASDHFGVLARLRVIDLRI